MMNRLPECLVCVVLLLGVLLGPAGVLAQSIPEVSRPVCGYCGAPGPYPVHSPGCPSYRAPAETSDSGPDDSGSGGSRPSGSHSGLTSRDINTMVAGALFESMLTSVFAPPRPPTEKEALAARQQAIALARQQMALKRAQKMAAQAAFDRMMQSYKQLDGVETVGFKPISNTNLDFKTLDGDMEALAAGARKPFDTAGTLKTPGPRTVVGGGTPFFGDTMPAQRVQFLVQPENDPNVVDLRNARTFVVQSLKDNDKLEARIKPYDDDDGNGKPIIAPPPDCAKSAKRLKELIRQRQYFQKTIDLAQEQLTTWQAANRNALINAAKDGLDWYTGQLLDRFVKRGEAADRLQRIYEKNAAQMAREGLNVAEIQAKIQRLKAWSAAGRLAEVVNNAKDWQTFVKDGASALLQQLTASNEEIQQMLEDPNLQKYFEAEAPQLKTLLDISKIAMSNKVFGKWVAQRIPLIAGVELAINETYNALDWYLSYRRLAEAQGINGHVLEAARQLQKEIDDTYTSLKECP